MTATRRLDKKAIWGYVVVFLTVFNVIYALLAYEDFRAIFICAGYNHASPLSISSRRQEVAYAVGQPWYEFFHWLDSWFVFSVWHDIFLVLIISAVIFALGIGLKCVVRKIIKMRKVC